MINTDEILKEFGLNLSIYQDYSDNKKEYKKLLEECKKKQYLLEEHRFLYYAILIIIVFIGWNKSTTILENLVVLIIPGFFCAYIASHIFMQLLEYFTGYKIYNFLSGGKYNKLIAEKEQLEKNLSELTDGIKNKVCEKEKALRNSYLKWLEDFKNENLFRKNSESVDFEESLSKYSSMINACSDINKILITTNISYWDLRDHEDYLKSRTKNRETTKIFGNQSIGTSKKEVTINSDVKKENLPKQRLNEVIVPPEIEYQKTKRVNLEKLPPSFIGKKIDWKELSESQKLTGERGEELVVELEKESLRKRGRSDLAGKVLRISKEKGDGLGYDVLSFYIGGREKYIEVKSTTVSLVSSFYISKNELSFLEVHKDDSFVYRILLTQDVGNYLVQVISSSDFLATSERIPVMFKVQM